MEFCCGVLQDTCNEATSEGYAERINSIVAEWPLSFANNIPAGCFAGDFTPEDPSLCPSTTDNSSGDSPAAAATQGPTATVVRISNLACWTSSYGPIVKRGFYHFDLAPVHCVLSAAHRHEHVPGVPSCVTQSARHAFQMLHMCRMLRPQQKLTLGSSLGLRTWALQHLVLRLLAMAQGPLCT